MSDYEIYDMTIRQIKTYFGTKEAEKLFLHGGCYWLANYLHNRLSNSYIMFNKEQEHCAIEFQNKLYDITGRISSKKYCPATSCNISYMKKNYKPEFDTGEVERYLRAVI